MSIQFKARAIVEIIFAFVAMVASYKLWVYGLHKALILPPLAGTALIVVLVLYFYKGLRKQT